MLRAAVLLVEGQGVRALRHPLPQPLCSPVFTTVPPSPPATYCPAPKPSNHLSMAFKASVMWPQPFPSL